MLIQSTQMFKSLLSINQYLTMKSKRQFTPNLIQNPKLTKHGIIQKIPKNYHYNLPQNLPNRHLFWDRTIQNKARRVKYNQNKLRKLQIKPIHENGQRVYNRTLEQILKEITSMKVVRESQNRTFENLKQILIRFRKNLSAQDLKIVHGCISDIHQRYLPSFSLYHFSTFCQLRCLAGLNCTEKIFVHFYKFIQQFSEQSQKGRHIKKFSLKIFLALTKYVFFSKSASYLQNNKQMLYKNREMFKIFEDNDPRFISFEELVPYVYSKEEVKQQLNDEKVIKNLKYLQLLPGGNVLLQNITK